MNREYMANERFRVRDFNSLVIDHDEWQRQNNPQGWDAETWALFTKRYYTETGFKALVDELHLLRHALAEAWAEQEIAKGDMATTNAGQIRRRCNWRALKVHPRPDPRER